MCRSGDFRDCIACTTGIRCLRRLQADAIRCAMMPSLRRHRVAFRAQITTCKGIVMARLRSTVRELEVALMRFCFEKLGAQP